jgi:hypothetical protein
MNISKKLKIRIDGLVKNKFVAEYHHIDIKDGSYQVTFYKRVFDRSYGVAF